MNQPKHFFLSVESASSDTYHGFTFFNLTINSWPTWFSLYYYCKALGLYIVWTLSSLSRSSDIGHFFFFFSYSYLCPWAVFFGGESKEISLYIILISLAGISILFLCIFKRSTRVCISLLFFIIIYFVVFLSACIINFSSMFFFIGTYFVLSYLHFVSRMDREESWSWLPSHKWYY